MIVKGWRTLAAEDTKHVKLGQILWQCNFKLQGMYDNLSDHPAVIMCYTKTQPERS